LAATSPNRSDKPPIWPETVPTLYPCAWQALDQITRALGVSDAQGRLCYANAAMQALLARLDGGEGDGGASSDLARLLAGEAGAMSARRAITDEKALNFEIEARGRLGIRTHLRVTIDPLPEGISGAMIVGPRALIAVDDITKETMALEQALERELSLKGEIAALKGSPERGGDHAVRLTELVDTLALAKDEAARAKAAKAALLAMLSQEVRTPMNGVLGMTWLLLETALDEQQRVYARTAQESGEALLTVINDVLDVARIESGELVLEQIPLDLQSVVRAAERSVAAKAAEKSVALRVRFDSGLPVRIKGDPARLRQMLHNLIGSALGFTDKGSVSLVVSLRPAKQSAPTLRFEVRDTGTGAAAESRGRLFESAALGDLAALSPHGSAGLGLAVCHRLAALMKGRIGVETDPRTGGISWLELPCQPVVEAGPGLVAADLGQFHVVAIAPAVDRRSRLMKTLGAAGVSAEPAVSVADGLARLRSGGHGGARRLVVIFAADALAEEAALLAREIGRDAALHGVSLVLLAQAGLRGDATRSRALGYAAYLSEPAGSALIVRCLRELDRVSDSPSDAGAEPITVHSLREAAGRTPVALVAEDHPVNQRLAVAFLERLGCTAVVVGDGAAAVERIKAGGIDLVLMDVQMKGMDGLAATRAIRALGSEATRLPIIALTGHTQPGDEERCRAAGMDDFVPKPIEPERLKRTLLRWVRRGSAVAPPETPELTAADPTAPVLDGSLLDQLETAIGQKSVRELVTIYLDTTDERLDALERALAIGDCKEVGQEAHDLKSTSGNLGASRLFAQARALESAARKQKTDEIALLARPVRDQFNAVRAAFLARYRN